EWARAALDTTVIEAETEILKLWDRYQELKKSDAARAAKLARAVTELREWDHVGTVHSVPMTVFTLWYWKQSRDNKAKQDPIGTLEDVLKDLQEKFGTWEVPWGEINRIQRAQSGGEEPFSDSKPSFPVAGGPGPEGIVFNFYARPEKGQKRRYGVAGHSFVSVVEFGPQIQARSILVFGENSDPASPHYLDQTRLYANQQFKAGLVYARRDPRARRADVPSGRVIAPASRHECRARVTGILPAAKLRSDPLRYIRSLKPGRPAKQDHPGPVAARHHDHATAMHLRAPPGLRAHGRQPHRTARRRT
ncbi:MAG: hypothetical protein DMG57_12950, partial [Acidobacteria bacterium]